MGKSLLTALSIECYSWKEVNYQINDIFTFPDSNKDRIL